MGVSVGANTQHERARETKEREANFMTTAQKTKLIAFCDCPTFFAWLVLIKRHGKGLVSVGAGAPAGDAAVPSLRAKEGSQMS